MQHFSPLDGYRAQIEQWLNEGESNRQIADLLTGIGLPTTEASIRRALRRWGIESPKSPNGPNWVKSGCRVRGDDAEITSDPRAWKATLNDTNALIRERGLDPEDWEIASLSINEWDSPTGETLKQLKVQLKRKKLLDLIIPARVRLGKIFPKIKHLTSESEAELVVLVGDQHAPYQDPELHRRFCAFLNDQEPKRGVLMGDGVDLPTISRHPAEPDWAPIPQECVDAFGQVVLDYKEASKTTNWVKLPGNHLERLRRAIIDRLGDFYKLTPANIEGLPQLRAIHDPAYLLRLDELGVEYIEAKGSYKHAQYMVTPYLAAKHGSVAAKGSGTSALKTLDGLDHSIIIGHTHRQSLVQKTVQQIDRTGRLLQAAETGCMCLIEDGLGYAPGPDWSNGFITASVWPDGTFKLDLATYVDSHLYWRSERY